MAVTVLPPPGAATANKSASSTTSDDLKAMLARAKGTITRTASKHKAVTTALLLTAEIQASMFGWSFASGYAAKKGKSLKLMGVDTRPVIAIMLAGGALFSEDAAPHLFAVANGTLGSFMAEWAFDLGVRAATSKEEKEAADAAKKAAAPAPTTAASGVPDDVPPAIRLHVAREAGAAEWAAGDVEVETGSGLRLTPQANLNHWYRVWGREMAQYKAAKAKGHQKHADRSLANAQNAKASGLNVYKRAKEKGRAVTMPEGWKAKPKVQPQQQQRGGGQQSQRAPVRVVRPQQPAVVYDELPYDENTVYDEYAYQDEGAELDGLEAPGQGEFFNYLENLDEAQLDAISGSDEEAGEYDETGDLPLEWPSDEFADFMPNANG